MNRYMISSLQACLSYLETFDQNIRMAASKDDGRVDPGEERALKKISRASDCFRRRLKKMLEEE